MFEGIPELEKILEDIQDKYKSDTDKPEELNPLVSIIGFTAAYAVLIYGAIKLSEYVW